MRLGEAWAHSVSHHQITSLSWTDKHVRSPPARHPGSPALQPLRPLQLFAECGRQPPAGFSYTTPLGKSRHVRTTTLVSSPRTPGLFWHGSLLYAWICSEF